MKIAEKLLVLLLAIFSFSGFAQSLPPGPYLESCSNVHWEGPTLLVAMCSGGPAYLETALQDANQCSTPIQNIHGRLVCQNLRSSWPRGSYPDTCIDMALNEDFLTARCYVQLGASLTWLSYTFLNLNSCPGFSMGQPIRVVNAYGRLICE